jgi:SM-20-related protein
MICCGDVLLCRDIQFDVTLNQTFYFNMHVMTDKNQLERASDWLREANIQALLEQGFFVIDDACPASLFTDLQQECQQLQAEFKQARIAQGGLNQLIRGDVTRWLLPEDPAGRIYLDLLEKLGRNLNQYLYSGIRRVEAHYATYAVGDFYKLHRDNPLNHATNDLTVTGNTATLSSTSESSNLVMHSAHQQARVFSTVFYLNTTWQAAWHGELHLQDNYRHWHRILPMPNRLVVFQSNLLHEVCAASHERHSIAGWLRRDAALF